ENCWAGLPEGTAYQFYVFVEQRRGVRRLEEALPPISGGTAKEKLFEEFRRARLQELTRLEDDGTAANLVQDRRHCLSATFQPIVAKSSALSGVLQDVTAQLKALAGRRPRQNGANGWETTYSALVEEATRFARRVEVGLSQMGLRYQRCK